MQHSKTNDAIVQISAFGLELDCKKIRHLCVPLKPGRLATVVVSPHAATILQQ